MNLPHLRRYELVSRVSHSLKVVDILVVDVRQTACTRNSLGVLTRRGLVAAKNIEEETVYILELVVLGG
jgi:hypothetical protein